jgi:hypothetical protein
MRGAVRASKLYYLRDRSGRAARVAEDTRQKTVDASQTETRGKA